MDTKSNENGTINEFESDLSGAVAAARPQRKPCDDPNCGCKKVKAALLAEMTKSKADIEGATVIEPADLLIQGDQNKIAGSILYSFGSLGKMVSMASLISPDIILEPEMRKMLARSFAQLAFLSDPVAAQEQLAADAKLLEEKRNGG